MNRTRKIDWAEVRARVEACEDDLAKALHPDPNGLLAIFEERARHLAERRSDRPQVDDQLRLLEFRVGQSRYAFELRCVVAVGFLTRYVPIPGGPPELAGIINDRGAVCSVTDLGRMLGIASDSAQAGRYFVHVRASDLSIRFKVGELEQVMQTASSNLVASWELGLSLPADWVQGCMNDGTVILRAEALCRACVAARDKGARRTPVATNEFE